MNIFRLCGDGLHLASFLVLLYMMLSKKNCSGISLKSQILYCVVFLSRYADLPFHFINVYLTVMKTLFITLSIYIVYLMKVRFRSTYEEKFDTFQWGYLFGFAAVMGLVFNHGYDPLSLLFAFSEWLEAVAVLPQLWMLQLMGGTQEILTYQYLIALGGYRFFYLLNWMYRYIVEGRVLVLQWVAGSIQTIIFVDLFYHYFTRVIRDGRLELPNGLRTGVAGGRAVLGVFTAPFTG